jgi:UDP-glucuronate decarboxylase
LTGDAETCFVVTGATGWLGKAALDTLEGRLGDDFARRVFAYASAACVTTLLSGRSVPCSSLVNLSELPPGRYVFLHCAFLGKERVRDLPLTDFIQQNEAISETVCDVARRAGAEGFFIPSSGAVYGKDGALETDLERNPYGVMKRRDEERFLQLSEELQRPLVISRVFNVAGPYANKLDSYALSSILTDVLYRRPVQLRAAYPVIRSYVHVGDLLALALACLNESDGRMVTRFDTAGDGEIELGELARLALEVMGASSLAIMRPSMTGQHTDRYVGDRDVFFGLLRRHGIAPRGLRQQIQDTSKYLETLLP